MAKTIKSSLHDAKTKWDMWLLISQDEDALRDRNKSSNDAINLASYFEGKFDAFIEAQAINAANSRGVDMSSVNGRSGIQSETEDTIATAETLIDKTFTGVQEQPIEQNPSICPHGILYIKCKKPECVQAMMDAEAAAYCPHGFLAGCPECTSLAV